MKLGGLSSVHWRTPIGFVPCFSQIVVRRLYAKRHYIPFIGRVESRWNHFIFQSLGLAWSVWYHPLIENRRKMVTLKLSCFVRWERAPVAHFPYVELPACNGEHIHSSRICVILKSSIWWAFRRVILRPYCNFRVAWNN